MAKVKKTNRELLGIIAAINAVSSNQEENEKNDKGIKKLQKIGAKLKPYVDSYNEAIEDIRLDHAHTDEQGCLILDEKGGYKFTKEGLKNMNKAVTKYLDSEFEVYQFTFSQEGISRYQFLEGWVEGLVFPKQEEEEVDEEVPVVSIDEVI